MARFIRTLNGYNQPVDVKWRVAINQTINVGDIVQLNTTSRRLEAAVAASTTLVGVAQEAITTGGTVTAKDAIKVTPLTGGVFRIDFTGSSKTTLAETDLVTTLFDLSNKTTMNLDDTSGGMCSVLSFNNGSSVVTKYADVAFAAANVVRI
jgi:hypothetical protein